MICYNLRRLMSILSPKELKNRLKSIYLFVLYTIDPILDYIKDLIYAKLNPFSKIYQFKRTLNHNLLPFWTIFISQNGVCAQTPVSFNADSPKNQFFYNV